jgi:hypothetical protein
MTNDTTPKCQIGVVPVPISTHQMENLGNGSRNSPLTSSRQRIALIATGEPRHDIETTLLTLLGACLMLWSCEMKTEGWTPAGTASSIRGGLRPDSRGGHLRLAGALQRQRGAGMQFRLHVRVIRMRRPLRRRGDSVGVRGTVRRVETGGSHLREPGYVVARWAAPRIALMTLPRAKAFAAMAWSTRRAL